MADVPAVSFNNTWKAVMTITTLLFNAGIIIFCLGWGAKDNSLHSSAMAWAFMVDFAILAGLGIGAALPTIAQFFTTKGNTP